MTDPAGRAAVYRARSGRTAAVLAAVRDATGPELTRAPVRPEHLTGTP
ncbi:hypothetical protein ABTY20_31895 [Streptomyces sp. NPDC126497]